jgi:hypothetical protein
MRAGYVQSYETVVPNYIRPSNPAGYVNRPYNDGYGNGNYSDGSIHGFSPIRGRRNRLPYGLLGSIIHPRSVEAGCHGFGTPTPCDRYETKRRGPG